MKRIGSMQRRGNTILEAAMIVPVITILLVGMMQVGKITYVYYTLRKTLYTLARYVATQQGVNFCDEADATVTAAKNFALYGTTDNSGTPVIPGLTPDQVLVQVERYDASAESLGDCACDSSGCDVASGGGEPDFVVVSIPDGFEVAPRIPFLRIDPIPLKPLVRVPFGGT